MKERPILFSGPMVRAILREVDPKTQTRRVVKLHPLAHSGIEFASMSAGEAMFVGNQRGTTYDVRCPYGVSGDLLYVREGFYKQTVLEMDQTGEYDSRWTGQIKYAADEIYPLPKSDKVWWKKRPSIHLPRRFSRIWLRVTDVRVERVQDISEADAEAEGCEARGGLVSGPMDPPEYDGYPATWSFRELWDSINAKRGYGWDTNPWVWVITYERTKAPSG